MPSNDDEKLATGSLCKIELKIVFGAHLLALAIGFILIPCLSLFSTSHLPYDCYIIFLPPDKFWLAWMFNYIFLTVTELFVTIFFTCYVSMPLLLMNQSCWLLDMIVMTADKMNNDLQLDGGMDVAVTSKSLFEVVARCEKFVEWKNEVQALLKWNFNLEFQVQSTILCFSIYVLSFVSTGVQLVAVVIFLSLTQLHSYCWMGSRVNTRIDRLSFEVSKNFYLMTPSQRKTLLSIVHWTQGMKGFRGFFNDVNLETFKKVKTLEDRCNFFSKFYKFHRFWRHRSPCTPF